MVKNKVLTPVLAGVLGLSIVGSGLGYYFVNKDSNDGKSVVYIICHLSKLSLAALSFTIITVFIYKIIAKT